MKAHAWIACCASAAALALAQDNTQRLSNSSEAGWRIPGTESFVMRSAIVQRDYEIMIALPRGYADSERKIPVLYVLDANGAFPIAVETARFLSFDRSTREEPIIVGIGYPVGHFRNTLPHRIRDFTPTADAEWVARIARDYGFTSDGSGGAAAFLQFLAEEMIPRVEQRYRIDERKRTLSGYSLGGLFAVYVLLHRPELFESYLIGAPNLEWEKELVWKHEQEYARTHRELPARVLFTVGLLDTSYLPLLERLQQLFRSRDYARLNWQAQYFPDETHNSAIGLSLSRGMRWLYSDLAPQSKSP